MQEWLDAVGCDVGNNDGIIGPLTLASLKAFQQGAGLTVDGVYGPKTKAALSADAQAKKQVCKKPTPPPAPVGPTGAGAACTATAIQAGLNAAITTGYTVKLDGFGCDQGWAYAYATVTPTGGESIDVTDVLAARNGAWVSQDRGVVCVKGKMPQDIYNGGCTSN
jgi:peptidoglycan hydrolase-like protein with peptidoglycan-binding domain